MASDDAVIAEIQGPVATVWLNRPERLNAWSAEIGTELVSMLEALQANDEVRGVILTGKGRAFSAGADLKNPRTHRVDDVSSALEQGSRIAGGIFDLVSHYEKPIVAAVNGYAIGVGCLVPLACDFVYAAESAQFQLPQVSLGILPAYGGSLRLARAVGNLNAAEMILTGRMVSAEEAGRWGIAAAVLPDEKLLDHARETMARVAGHPQVAVRMARESLRSAIEANSMRAAELADTDRFLLLAQRRDTAASHQAWRDRRK